MVRERKKQNRGLPLRWCIRHGAYYYQVPKSQKAHWDGKVLYRLGKTLPEAHMEWAKKMAGMMLGSNTWGNLLDRYELEVIPDKKPATQRREKQHIAKLREVFKDLPKGDLKPQHVYKYFDARSKKVTVGKKTTGGTTTAKHEVAVLSHVGTKAVEWGELPTHPFKGDVRLKGLKARDRYVEDWEIIECLRLPTKRKRGSIKAVQAYIRIYLQTSLRQTDQLKMKISQLTKDGIDLGISKTGKKVIIEWTPELRADFDDAIACRPVDIGPYVFCNKYGESYFNEENGQASSWWSMWGRFMNRVLKETEVTERFMERDLRAKCASDSESLEHARALLSHADSKITSRVYMRKPTRITPAKQRFNSTKAKV